MARRSAVTAALFALLRVALFALFMSQLGLGMVAAVDALPRRRYRTRGQRVIRFIEQNCVHTEGKWYGKPFKLLDWQKEWILALFEIDPETNLRRYRWALLGVPKKNGKTELVAALGLYFLVADGEMSPKVICAAASDKQADLLFGAASIMATESATLKHLLNVMADTIECPSNHGKLMRVSAVAGTNDGKNCSAVLIDELHEWSKAKAASIWTVLTGGIITRDQPMVIQITTAGFDEDTICYREYARGKAIQKGEAEDPAYFFTWYEAPEGCDVDDVAAWEACNPSWGVTINVAVLKDLRTKRTAAEFRRYNLNQWTDAEDSWLEEGMWDACRVKTQHMIPTVETWIAVDASTRRDSTAVTWGQWMMIADPDGTLRRRFLVRCRIWQRPLDPHTGEPAKGWKLPIAEVEEFVRQLATQFSELKDVGYDPYAFERSAQILEDEGLPMLEFPQHPSRMAPATMNFRTMIVDQEIAHEGAPDFARQVNAAVTVPVADGNASFRLSKGKSKKLIDAAASTAILTRMATTRDEEEEPKTPGVLFL